LSIDTSGACAVIERFSNLLRNRIYRDPAGVPILELSGRADPKVVPEAPEMRLKLDAQLRGVPSSTFAILTLSSAQLTLDAAVLASANSS
jgi:hypothetical protein